MVPSQLVNLKVKEVSGVDAAANMRKFLIVKSAAQGNTLKEKLTNLIKQYLPPKGPGAMTFAQTFTYDTIDDQLSNLMYDSSWALRDTIKSIMKDATVTDKLTALDTALLDYRGLILESFNTALSLVSTGAVLPTPTIGVIKSEGGSQVFNEEVLKGLPEDVRKGIEAMNAEIAKLKKAATETEPKEEDIFKGMSPAAIEVVKDLQKRATQAEEIAKAEREARLDREYTAKAAELSHLGVKAEELGPVLKSIGCYSKEDLEKVFAVMKAANNAIATGQILKEIGSGQAGTPDAWGQIEKAASELRKSDSKMSQAEALQKAMNENPDLYQKYKDEQMGL